MVRLLPLRSGRGRLQLAPETVLAGAWMVVLGALEILGRRSETDVHDSAAVLTLVSLGLITWRQHVRQPLKLVTAIGARIRIWKERWEQRGIDVGTDLRGEPPLPRAGPRRMWLTLLGAWALCALLWWQRAYFPGEARSAFLEFSAALYFLLLTVLWGLLLTGAAVAFVAPLGLLGELFEERGGKFERLRSEWVLACAAGSFAGYALCALVLPTVTPLVLVLLVLAGLACGLAWPRSPELLLVWRPRSGGSLRSFPWRWLALQHSAFLAAWIGILVLLGRGDRMTSSGEAASSVTAGLAGLFAWPMAGCFLGYAVMMWREMGLGRRVDPSRPRAPRVRIEGRLEREIGGVLSALRKEGFETTTEEAGPAEALDVRVRVLNESASETVWTWPPAPLWPLAVSADELSQADTLAKLRRRDEIQRRRAFLRGLEKLMRRLARRRPEQGRGLWIAPHLWYATRLTRDEDEEDRFLSGPRWHPTVPPAARAHLYDVMTGAQIDLIFVEDGIGFRRLRRVFALLFEYHDLFGGKRRAEERQFLGLPGVRVVIHDFDLEEPFQSKHYPEPDYEDIGRARILHVFRDRGGDEEDLMAPVDSGRRPEPVGAL